MSRVEEALIQTLAAVPLEFERHRTMLETGLQRFANGMRINGSRVVQMPAGMPAAGTTSLLWGGPCRVVGWSIRAKGGAAVVNFRDGRDTAAPFVGTVELEAPGSAGSTSNPWFGAAGATALDALSLEVESGAVVGCVYLGAVD